LIPPQERVSGDGCIYKQQEKKNKKNKKNKV